MTRLKALELHGFKSFADRTRFEFHSGVTAIVGPNGSGKSNVVDAIKWVLGEQSVRSLRGKEMTDVIFAGAAGRRPLNSAETTLIFDNTSRELSLAADEVRIGRRVYRSGESEYLINGEVSRLRDIRELFSGTGAATEAYSVIEQGRVDKLLVSSGKERRGVFEEAAGITKFRTRRAEALRRLERTEQNRQRLADIVGEVASRLETVLRQAARAKRWRVLSDRLKRCRLVAAASDLKDVDAELRRLDESRIRISTSHQEAQSNLKDFDARGREATRRVESLDQALENSEARVAEAGKRLAAAEAALEQIRARSHELESDLRQASESVLLRFRENRATASTEKKANARVTATAGEFEQLSRRLAQLRNTADGSLVDAEAAREASIRIQAEAADSHRKHLEKQVEQKRIAEQVATAETHLQNCRQRCEQAAADRARIVEAIAVNDGNLASLQDFLRDHQVKMELLESRDSELGTLIRTGWDTLSKLQSQLEACRERERVLAELSEQHEGVPPGVRAVLRGELPAPGSLIGMLADALDADATIAPLVDLALGHAGGSLVVEDLAAAIQWAADRQATNGAERLPAVGFIAARADCTTRFRPELTGLPGVVDRLDRMLACEPRVRPLITQLLGDTWVVETLHDASRLLPDAGSDACLVTADGILLSARGTLLTRGTTTGGLVARHSEQAKLEQRTRSLLADITRQQQALAALEQERAQAKETARHLRGSISQTQNELATSRAEHQRLIRDQRSAEIEIDRAGEARRLAERNATSINDEQTRIESELVSAAATEQHLTETLAASRRAIDDFDRSRGSLLDEIRDTSRLLDETRDRLSEDRDALRHAEATHAASRSAYRKELEQLQTACERKTHLDLECLRVQQTHAAAAILAEQENSQRRELHRERERCGDDVRKAAAGSRAAQDSLADLERQIHATDLAQGEARHTRSRIIERIREDYELDIDAEVSNPVAESCPPSHPDEDPIPDSRDALEQEIEQLRRKISSFSTVNLEALSEAEELEKRHVELQNQLDDVTQAKSSIEQLIKHIDDESRRLLAETIETVRGYFRELFERLFAGGQADIVIDPEEDLLDASVEIVARPPGKEPRNISLLSGGEKTMTCVALLLAIFKSRPSPFCVLDEVDAPLDEANVDRFTAVLRDSLSATQFIVVTHSKKTMAAATTLYGITMEQSGVSKRVSVRFEEAASVASKAA
jgi:chromosome segregation protein